MDNMGEVKLGRPVTPCCDTCVMMPVIRCGQFKRKQPARSGIQEENKMMRAQLTNDMMAQVNGGFAVDGGNGKFYAVDDKDGFIYNESTVNIQFAQYAAGMNGQSKEIITKEEYQRRFGRPIC